MVTADEEVTPISHAHGEAECLCAEIVPSDRPCVVCEAREFLRERGREAVERALADDD